MTLTVTAVNISWAAVTGSTSYELHRNGKKVATFKPTVLKASTASVASGDTLTILAQPSGSQQACVITAVPPVTPPAPPPTKFPAGMWPAAQNNSAPSLATMQAMKNLGAIAVYGAAQWVSSGWGVQLTSLGMSALATLGHMNADGSWSLTDEEALSAAEAAIAAGPVAAFLIADEPSPAYAAQLKARYALLKPLGVPVAFTYFDVGTVAQLTGCADLLFLDIYPSGSSWDMNLIPQLAAACDQVRISYVGVTGVFTDGGRYVYPTEAQAQQMFSLWAATKQLAPCVYCYGPGGGSQQLATDPAMQQVVKAALAV